MNLFKFFRKTPKPPPVVGQGYLCISDENNPFAQAPAVVVVAVQDGYVQYRFVEKKGDTVRPYGDPTSRSVESFLAIYAPFN